MHKKLSPTEKTKLVKDIESERLIAMRKPPWRCVGCNKEAIITFEWQKDMNMFKATCGNCGEFCYS